MSASNCRSRHKRTEAVRVFRMRHGGTKEDASERSEAAQKKDVSERSEAAQKKRRERAQRSGAEERRERAQRSEPRERSEPTKRLARERVRESEGRSPSE